MRSGARIVFSRAREREWLLCFLDKARLPQVPKDTLGQRGGQTHTPQTNMAVKQRSRILLVLTAIVVTYSTPVPM
jgi:hypothetical protein